jgi:hypothetical protein
MKSRSKPPSVVTFTIDSCQVEVELPAGVPFTVFLAPRLGAVVLVSAPSPPVRISCLARARAGIPRVCRSARSLIVLAAPLSIRYGSSIVRWISEHLRIVM